MVTAGGFIGWHESLIYPHPAFPYSEYLIRQVGYGLWVMGYWLLVVVSGYCFCRGFEKHYGVFRILQYMYLGAT